MINPADIHKKALRKYPEFLRSLISNETIFPLEIRSNKNPSKNLQAFSKELSELIKYSKEKKGYGYCIEFQRKNTRSNSTQDLPKRILFKTENDFVNYINKKSEVIEFIKNHTEIIKLFPELYEWSKIYPTKITKHQKSWNQILKVCLYFKKNPKPNIYIRELPIQVHTKFVESNKPIISELLDVLIASEVNTSYRKFEKRYNLKYSPPLVRFKILDPEIAKLYFSHVDDLSVPLPIFKYLDLSIDTIIVVENKTSLYTTLTLPLKKGTIAIFGSGFKVSNLKCIKWFQDKEILYWGDIDIHGFEILSQMRGYYSQTKSLMMDEETFLKFYENEKGSLSKTENLSNLTFEEHNLYLRIQESNCRLEQEKIPLDYVKSVFLKKNQ